jgi:hypothetical protein
MLVRGEKKLLAKKSCWVMGVIEIKREGIKQRIVGGKVWEV